MAIFFQRLLRKSAPVAETAGNVVRKPFVAIQSFGLMYAKGLDNLIGGKPLTRDIHQPVFIASQQINNPEVKGVSDQRADLKPVIDKLLPEQKRREEQIKKPLKDLAAIAAIAALLMAGSQ